MKHIINYSINRIPDDVHIARLTVSDAQHINHVWKHRTPQSLNYIESLLKLNKVSVGIFDRETNEILAWICTNYRYAIA